MAAVARAPAPAHAHGSVTSISQVAKGLSKVGISHDSHTSVSEKEKEPGMGDRRGSIATTNSTDQASYSLNDILRNKCRSPYTLAEFRIFMAKIRSEENLDFYEACVRYRKTAYEAFKTAGLQPKVFPDAAKAEPDVKATHDGLRKLNSGDSDEEINKDSMDEGLNLASRPKGSSQVSLYSQTEHRKLSKNTKAMLKDALQDIIDEYLVDGSPKEVNIPEKFRAKTRNDILVHGNLGPDVLSTLHDKIFENIRCNAKKQFAKEAHQNSLDPNYKNPSAGVQSPSSDDVSSRSSGGKKKGILGFLGSKKAKKGPVSVSEILQDL